MGQTGGDPGAGCSPGADPAAQEGARWCTCRRKRRGESLQHLSQQPTRYQYHRGDSVQESAPEWRQASRCQPARVPQPCRGSAPGTAEPSAAARRRVTRGVTSAAGRPYGAARRRPGEGCPQAVIVGAGQAHLGLRGPRRIPGAAGAVALPGVATSASADAYGPAAAHSQVASRATRAGGHRRHRQACQDHG